MKDKPWIFRTYAGHSNAAESNALYRRNLAKGQTGLSVAFDLPTQTGYDSDHVLANGEVGKVGVAISQMRDRDAHLSDLAVGENVVGIVADLPTQTGYDSDHVLANGEVGKVGVAISHLGDRDAHLSDLAVGENVVGIVAGLRRQIEGDREPGLALGEIPAIERIRLGRVRMARVGAKDPGLVFHGLRRCSATGAGPAGPEPTGSPRRGLHR